MRILLVEPWLSGSHRQWAEGYQTASSHEVSILGLPGTTWRWRLRGGALPLARQVIDWVAANGEPDLVVVSGLVDVAQLLGLVRRALPSDPPVVVYQHESQLVYPSPSGRWKQEAALHNWFSWCAADLVLFNSHHHLDAVADALPAFLRQLPDQSHVPFADEVVARFEVLPLGLDLGWVAAALGAGADGGCSGSAGGAGGGSASRFGDGGAPVIVWPHRWEADKAPDAFVAALVRAEGAGLGFRLVLAGEHPDAGSSQAAGSRAEVVERFGDRVAAVGPFATDHYRQLLGRCDLVVSCARHEFFGAAVAEAAAAGCVPVLPDDLAYPELIPSRWHDATLYPVDRFGSALTASLADLDRLRSATDGLAAAMARYDWAAIGPRYDQRLAQLLR